MIKEIDVREDMDVMPHFDYSGWRVNNPGKYPYGNSFRSVLNCSITQILREKKEVSHCVYALDFMGYGQILRTLPIDGGLFVALCDPRYEEEKILDQRKNINCVVGNALRRSTWNQMQDWLDSQTSDHKTFDMILCRAVRGLDKLTENPAVHAILLQRAWKMLSKHDGILLTQFDEPTLGQQRVFQEINNLNSYKGIVAQCSFTRPPTCEPIAWRPVISLKKNEDAPQELPIDFV